MNSEVPPPDSDRNVEMALEASGIRDEVEVLTRRMRGTAGAGLAISALFVAAGTFMEQSSTLWFLGVMWVFLTLRLVFINRACGREKRIKETALESLASPPNDDPQESPPQSDA